MVKLNLKREPTWIDLARGVRLKVKPASTALVMAARHAASRIEGDSAEVAGVRTATLIAELAKASVIAWEGVADDKGKPAVVNAEGVAALMELWPLAEAFERQYLAPLYALDAEKNV